MEIKDGFQLHEYDDENISDVIVKLQKSFRITFPENAFNNVHTFGDLCDVFEVNIKSSHNNQCTTQQAFYKIRQAINEASVADSDNVLPGSKLADLFPVKHRRTTVRKFRRAVGIKVDMLTYPGWLLLTLTAVFIISLVAFFYDWRIAVSGIIISITGFSTSGLLGNTLNDETVRELTEKMVHEHYTECRRFPGTVNRREIVAVIKDVFSKALYIDKSHLTRESRFGWAMK